MKFLADENVKRRLTRWLKVLGHDVLIAEKGVKNSNLFSLAKKEGRILITNDTDFLNTALYPPQRTPGRIVLRVFPPVFENQRFSLESLLSKFTNEKEFTGQLIELWQEDFETRA